MALQCVVSSVHCAVCSFQLIVYNLKGHACSVQYMHKLRLIANCQKTEQDSSRLVCHQGERPMEDLYSTVLKNAGQWLQGKARWNEPCLVCALYSLLTQEEGDTFIVKK